MSDAVTTSGLRADPSMRLAQASKAAPGALSVQLDIAAEQMARLGNQTYDRLARFKDTGVQVIQSGASAAPGLFTTFASHMQAMHSGAREGIRSGMLQADRFANERIAQVDGHILRTRESLVNAATGQARAVGAFARAARASLPERLGYAAAHVAQEAGRLRRWASGVAMGAIMLTGMAAQSTLDTGRRLGRFFSEGAIATYAGATAGMRNAAQNRYVRAGGVMAGIAAIGVMGFGAGMHAPGIMHGLGNLHAQLPDPAGITHAVARAIRGGFEAHDQIATASVDWVRSVASSATQKGATYYSQLASMWGQSAVAHEVAQVSLGEHSRILASSLAEHATPAATLGGHVVQATAQAAVHGTVHAADATHGLHHAVAHAGAHPAVHHVAQAVHGTRQFGDHTADAYNGAELLKIKIAGADHLQTAAAHLSGAGHAAGSVPLPTDGTAPTVAVHAQALAAPVHAGPAAAAPAVAAAHTPQTIFEMASHAMHSVGDVMPTMPSIDVAAAARSLFGAPQVQAPVLR